MDDGRIEPLPPGSLLARIGGEGWQYGDPYRIMVVVVPIDKTTCEIRGLDKHPSLEDMERLEEALADRGFGFLEFDRRIDGKPVRHRIELRRT